LAFCRQADLSFWLSLRYCQMGFAGSFARCILPSSCLAFFGQADWAGVAAGKGLVWQKDA
jgi:hypothetical protein